MNCSKQETYNYADYLFGSSSSASDGLTGYKVGSHCWSGEGKLDSNGFSGVHTNAIYSGCQSAFAPMNVVPEMTEPLINHFHVNGCSSIYDMAESACSINYGSCGIERHDALAFDNWNHDERTFSAGAYEDMECQQYESHPFEQRALDISKALDLQSNLVGKATLGSSVASLKTMPRHRREKAKLSEYNRRITMKERLQALQDLLPESSKGNNRDSIIDKTMNQIEYLQLQLKELSASRLGGEQISEPLFFLQGHGHYYLHEKTFKNSLEEVVGSLMEENLVAASKLLESKGLHLVPIASVDVLSER